jgi:sigma-B regulation protein RsbU (phosphoserine phosphatase)
MTAIDRRFFREGYNAELILTELSEAIPGLAKTKQLVELVAAKIGDALHPESVTIFLDDEAMKSYVAAISSEVSNIDVASGPHAHNNSLPYNGKIIRRLREHNTVSSVDVNEIDLSQEYAGLDGVFDPESETLRALRASLLIPITSNDHLHGLISLGPRLSDMAYAREDKRLLAVVANQIAAFIEKMKMISHLADEERIARELEMAAEVQRHLFPAGELVDDVLEIYGVCFPALGIGGDYYDYFEIDDRQTAIAIADVAGKGISAALLMSTVQASLRCQLTSGDTPLTDVVSTMNRLLRRSTGDAGYATFFLASFDKAEHRLAFVNAGHLPPILVRGGVPPLDDTEAVVQTSGTLRRLPSRANGSRSLSVPLIQKRPVIKLLTTGGPIIGTFFNEPYQLGTVVLESGDVLVVYTDGVTEALNSAGEEFGEDRLKSIVVDSPRLPARELGAAITARVFEWQGEAPQHDDLTLIVVRVK